MEPVSVVIITFNEAENIGRCIDAAAKVAAEVVVLDSYSTDATEIIARQKGAHFLHPQWQHFNWVKYTTKWCKKPPEWPRQRLYFVSPINKQRRRKNTNNPAGYKLHDNAPYERSSNIE